MRTRGLDYLITELVERIKAAPNKVSVRDVLDQVTRELGFERFALIHHADLRRDSSELIHLDTYPPVWAEHFIQDELYIEDPILQASARTAVGFRWSAVFSLVKPTPVRRHILESAAREGLGEGFTVPCNIPGERRGSCSFATRAGRPLPERSLIIAQHVGLFAFEAARRLATGGRTPAGPPSLSPRQRECIILAGQGKSDSVIAELLGLSEGTVTKYLAAARDRYGVATRIQLATCALYDGEIGFSELLPRG